MTLMWDAGGSQTRALFQRFHGRLDSAANEPRRRLRCRMGASTEETTGVDIFTVHISRLLLLNARMCSLTTYIIQ